MAAAALPPIPAKGEHVHVSARYLDDETRRKFDQWLMQLPEASRAAPGTQDHYLLLMKRYFNDELRLGQSKLDYRHSAPYIPLSLTNTQKVSVVVIGYGRRENFSENRSLYTG